MAFRLRTLSVISGRRRPAALGRVALCAALLGLSTPVAEAQLVPGGPPSPPTAERPVIGADLQLRRGMHRSGITPPAILAAEQAGAAVWLGLTHAPTEDDARRLAAAGLILDRTAAGRLGRGTVHRGWIAWTDLDRLARHPNVRRIEAARPAIALSPLETIGRQQGTTATHLRPDDGLTGEGAVIAAIDSPIDPAHPHFFHADGGVHPWIDDGDGVLAAGDSVDIDGVVAPLVVLDGGFIDPLVGADWQNLDDRLDPKLDWLFADLDGDGARGVGAAQGFTDDDPALGEPLFVAHDADGDGRITPDERLFRLGTSKIRQTAIGGQTWRRGRDLADAIDAARETDASHGTGVASILLGGQPGFHERVGLAPGAEYLGYAQLPEGVTPFADAAEHGALLMLHEWSQPAGDPGDGGSLFEQAMDEARADGMLQVCPLGNLNGAGKQVERAVDDDGVGRLGFEVGDGFFDGQRRRPYGTLIMHVAWTGGAQAQGARWRLPDGSVIDIQPGAEPQRLGDEMAYAVQVDETARGTRWLLLYVWHPDGPGNSLDQGRWDIEVLGLPPGTRLHGRLTDEHSGWAEGVHWSDATDDLTSLTYPSTADSAIGVAAFGGRMDMDGQFGGRVGELRAYSGRGPRIDGARAVDITAPDDPLAAIAWSSLGDVPVGHSALFYPFGGTSGAGPHVAAALALQAELRPDWSADDLEAHLFATADGDGLVPDAGPLPNEGWGHGKLRTHFALFGEPAPGNNRPPVADGLRLADGALDVLAASDPDGDRLRFRLDLHYDGQWDGPWQESPRLLLPDGAVEPGVEFVARVALRDVRGAGSARVGVFTVRVPPPDTGLPDAAPGGAGDGGAGDGGVSDGGVSDGGVVIVDDDQGVVIIGADDEGGGGGGGPLIGCRAQPGSGGAPWLWPIVLGAAAIRRAR